MFESYIIDSDFLVNFDLKDKENKLNNEEDEKLKCYPKRASNKAPYKKIEFQIQKEPHWPPITNQNNSSLPITAAFTLNQTVTSKNNDDLNQINEHPSVNKYIFNSLNRSSSKKNQTKCDDNNLEMKTDVVVNFKNNSTIKDKEYFEEFTKI